MDFGKLSNDVQVSPAACIHPSEFISFILIALFEIGADSLPKTLIRLQDHEVTLSVAQDLPSSALLFIKHDSNFALSN